MMLVPEKNLNICDYDRIAMETADDLRRKYSKYTNGDMALIAIVIADYADDLRRGLFNAEG